MKWLVGIFGLLLIGWVCPLSGYGEEMTQEQIIEEIRALKQRIQKLENEAAKKDAEIERLKEQSVKKEDVAGVVEEMAEKDGPLAWVKEHVKVSGLIEVGGAWESVDQRAGGKAEQSDLNLTTLELGVEVQVNEWVNTSTTLLFEDATFGGESGFDVDEAFVTFGNPEKFPLYVSGGVMYVPFGALLTHFPDDPLIDDPLTLSLGETREKAVLIGLQHNGLNLSGFVFNGDMDQTNEENQIESFGFNASYAMAGEKGFDMLVGASYISNIADSDGLTDYFVTAGTNTLMDQVGGFDAYFHVAYLDFFFDAEYMTAIEDFEPAELTTGSGEPARPSVWNIEAGYNWDWWRNLEIAFKYAGSDESVNLGFPKNRYGVVLNQTLFDGVIASLGYLLDDFEITDTRDKRDVVFGQVAVEF